MFPVKNGGRPRLVMSHVALGGAGVVVVVAGATVTGTVPLPSQAVGATGINDRLHNQNYDEIATFKSKGTLLKLCTYF